jgi:ribosomal protein S25
MPDDIPSDAPASDPAPIEQPEPAPEAKVAPQAPETPPSAPPDPTNGSDTPNEPLTPGPAPEPPPVVQPSSNFVRDLAAKARVVIQDRKHKKLDKVMALFDTKKQIENRDVEKLLKVSDATATRYLEQLEKQGKITQVGKHGRGVLYIKV